MIPKAHVVKAFNVLSAYALENNVQQGAKQVREQGKHGAIICKQRRILFLTNACTDDPNTIKASTPQHHNYYQHYNHNILKDNQHLANTIVNTCAKITKQRQQTNTDNQTIKVITETP